MVIGLYDHMSRWIDWLVHMYSATSSSSLYLSLHRLLHLYHAYIYLCSVGNKVDKEPERRVPKSKVRTVYSVCCLSMNGWMDGWMDLHET